MSSQFALRPLHLDPAQEFPHEIFNILRIENIILWLDKLNAGLYYLLLNEV
jgi:hypothetical protein